MQTNKNKLQREQNRERLTRRKTARPQRRQRLPEERHSMLSKRVWPSLSIEQKSNGSRSAVESSKKKKERKTSSEIFLLHTARLKLSL